VADFSVYPDAIDGYAQLPLVVDTKTRVDAISVNRLRSAIFNIEKELGVLPSSDSYETVRERLDALEFLINQVSIPPLIGQQYAVLMENPIGQMVWSCVRPSFLCPDFEILSFSVAGGSLIELGDTLTTPAFSASYGTPPVLASVSDNQSGPSQDVISTPGSFSYSESYIRSIYGANVIWTLNAEDNLQTDSATISKTWAQKVYWGVGAAGQNSQAFIKALSGSALATSRSRTFSVNPGASQKIYYAYRSGFGNATFTVGGFEGGFIKVSDTISLTNDFGITEDYTLYESDNVGLGPTVVVVS